VLANELTAQIQLAVVKVGALPSHDDVGYVAHAPVVLVAVVVVANVVVLPSPPHE
jgi:hypothetical protein